MHHSAVYESFAQGRILIRAPLSLEILDSMNVE